MGKEIKNIAMQWESISFNHFKENYNNLKIVDLNDLNKLSKGNIDDNKILVMASRRYKKPDKLDLILEKLDEHDKLFKAHGWIK